MAKSQYTPGEGSRLSDLPLVSIIISNYNGREYLKDCIASLERTTYPNKEIIVVDSGSTDGAADVVEKEFPWVRLIRKKKIGVGEAINTGIRSAQGEILVLDLNNDEVVSRNWLEPLVEILVDNPEVGIACPKRYLWNTSDLLDSAGDRIWLGICYARGHNQRDSERYHRVEEIDSAPVIATRKDVIDKVGLFDEEYYIYGEDVDFSLRTKIAGYRIVFVPESVQYHKVSGTVGRQSPARLYYNARARILWIRKLYPLHMKITLLLLHLTILPPMIILYYTWLSKGGLLSFLKAHVWAITDGLMRKRRTP